MAGLKNLMDFHVLKVWLGSTLLLATSACASQVGQPVAREDEMVKNVAGEVSKDVAKVAERAQKRWNAVLKEDYAAAYQFLSPGYREVNSAQRYARTLPLGFWTDAKVGEVECADVKCVVNVTIKFKQNFMGREILSSTKIREIWLGMAGEWWYVPGQ